MKLYKQVQKFFSFALASTSALLLTSFSSANAALTALDVQPVGDDVALSVTNTTPVVIAIMVATLSILIGIGFFKSAARKAAS